MRVIALAYVACAGSSPRDTPRLAGEPTVSVLAETDAAIASPLEDAIAPAESVPELWLRGSTHVHARPSGDSSEPIDKVVAWYEAHGYDFIALTDHNRVSELDPHSDTTGQVAIRAPDHGLIVLAGTELTHNPVNCVPAGDKSGNCRIHVNVLGPTARPKGKLDWPDRHTHDRLAKYESALVAARAIDGKLVQINHPQWLWGMTPDLLIELAHRGVTLVEIANVQFPRWNAGDRTHPSTEALWDAALEAGVTMWGIADDDAHAYEGRGDWPAGGGWIVVRAARDPQAILDAIAAGRFYASTGVELEHALPDDGDLVVDVADGQPGRYTIAFVENGKVVETVDGAHARRAIRETGYLRAVVTRDDGKKAWIQPVRRR